MIPNTIHYVWFGRGKKSVLVENCIASWKRYMPDYRIKEWNEENSPIDHPYLKKALKNRQWAFAADLMRCVCLYSEGGIHLDTDAEAIKSFDPLLNNRGFLGYEGQNTDYPVNAIMGFIPNHPFLKMMIDFYTNELAHYYRYVQQPRITKKILNEYLADKGISTDSDITIYPYNYFYPYNPFEPSRGIKQLMFCHLTPDTYAIHHYAASWITKSSLLKRVANKLNRLVRKDMEKVWFK